MLTRLAALLLLVVGTLASGVAPAAAFPARVRAEEPSVFPIPRDPWRSWGVTPAPGQVERHGGGAPVETPFVRSPRHAIWVEPAWFWNGFQWVWVPGHWAW